MNSRLFIRFSPQLERGCLVGNSASFAFTLMTCAGLFRGPQVGDVFPSYLNYHPPPLSAGNMFPDPQAMPETVDSTKPCLHCVFPAHTHASSVRGSTLQPLLGMFQFRC